MSWHNGSNVYETYKEVEIYDNQDNDKIPIVETRLHSDFSSKKSLLRLVLKRMRTDELMETKPDQVLNEVEDDSSKVDTASQERKVVPFKKRRHVQQVTHENLGTTICTMEEEQVLKQSDTGSVSPTKRSSLHEFWLEERKKRAWECIEVPPDSGFTKEQSDIVRQLITQASRRDSCVDTNIARSLKTHRCRRCEFTISHQCTPLDCIRSIPSGANLLNQTYMSPGTTVICDCGFAFCHAHLKRTRPPVKLNTHHLQPHHRFFYAGCAKCYIKIIMDNLGDVCCDLAPWDSIAGDYREWFYADIQHLFYHSETTAPSFDGFMACSKGCCLIFHRCSGKVEAPGASSSSPV